LKLWFRLDLHYSRPSPTPNPSPTHKLTPSPVPAHLPNAPISPNPTLPGLAYRHGTPIQEAKHRRRAARAREIRIAKVHEFAAGNEMDCAGLCHTVKRDLVYFYPLQFERVKGPGMRIRRRDGAATLELNLPRISLLCFVYVRFC